MIAVKKGETWKMWEVLIGVAFILFLLMFGGKFLQPGTIFTIPFSMQINREISSYPCGNIAGRSVVIANYPNGMNLIESQSQLRSSAQVPPYIEVITYGNEINRRVDYDPYSGKQVLTVQFTKNVPQDGMCSHNVKLSFESAVTCAEGSRQCSDESLAIVCRNNHWEEINCLPGQCVNGNCVSLTTTTTIVLDRPPPTKNDVFGLLFKFIEDIGRWVKSLFGFSTQTWQPEVIVDAGSNYQKTFTFNMQGIPRASCYNPVVYNAGNCNYLNKCYMIMPEGCADLSCAAKKDCVDITATAQSTETLTVTFTPTQLNKNYAVVAFIAESDMTYVVSSKTWSENTFIVESTKQSDTITVPGAGVPPVAKGIVELFTQFMLDLINFIKGLFGG